MSAAGIRRLAHSRDGARKGAVGATHPAAAVSGYPYRRRTGAEVMSAETSSGAGEGPLHGEELGGGVVIVSEAAWSAMAATRWRSSSRAVATEDSSARGADTP